MTTFDALLLGIVEGVTEFLPVSSTGHLIVAGRLLGLPDTEFLRTFNIAIQLGAILAVVVLFWKRFLDVRLVSRIAAAFIPTALIGFALYPVIKDVLLSSATIVVVSLAVGGVVLIAVERLRKTDDASVRELGDIGYGQAALIGLVQAVSVIPGVSRSGASIAGGLMFGLSRTAATEFSFLLAVPVMCAATGYDLLRSSGAFSSADWSVLAVGFAVSFVVALASIAWLIRFVKDWSFVPFGVYRIIAAGVFALLIL